MKIIIISLLLISFLFSFGQVDSDSISQKDTLFRIHEGGLYEIGVPCGYINQNADTIIPIGKYSYCFTDSIIDFGFVMQKGEKPVAIDIYENILYEVYWFDNGPDYINDNRFRIIKNNKIGYANSKGEIIIEPQFMCANQFKSGIAKVSYNCDYEEPDDEGHRLMSSDEWILIDTTGNKVTNQNIGDHLKGRLSDINLHDSTKSGVTIKIRDTKSIDTSGYSIFINGVIMSYDSIKNSDRNTINNITVLRELHKFQYDIGLPDSSAIVLISTKKGKSKCDSILSSKYQFYDKYINSLDKQKIDFIYKDEIVDFNEIIGFENQISLKENNDKLIIEITKNNNKP